MLFNEENYGKPISLQLSDYLREFTGDKDRALVCEKDFINAQGDKYNVSLSTLKYVVLRTNNLTEANSKAVVELMKIAVKNCTNKVAYYKQGIKELESQLQEA